MREVICGDAIEWLQAQPVLLGCSLVASLPDISEFQSFSLSQWQSWFIETARLILSKCPDDGVTVFYQSDVKYDGQWVAKDFLCQLAAREEGFHLVWHKIVCRAVPGSTSFGRPLYSHMLCFSRGVKADISKASVDVLPDVGEKTWERGMGLEACMTTAKFIREQTTTRKVVHPFCGEGSMLACANHVGLEALGVERSPKRSDKARLLQLHLDGKKWA